VCCQRGGFLGLYVVEEVGCQAHRLSKKQVFRPMSILSKSYFVGN
jgi:hypothetical protein